MEKALGTAIKADLLVLLRSCLKRQENIVNRQSECHLIVSYKLIILN